MKLVRHGPRGVVGIVVEDMSRVTRDLAGWGGFRSMGACEGVAGPPPTSPLAPTSAVMPRLLRALVAAQRAAAAPLDPLLDRTYGCLPPAEPPPSDVLSAGTLAAAFTRAE